MTMHTDCSARRIRTVGCDCAFCSDNAILRDGEGVRVSVRFSDSGAPEADHWPAAIFDAAGVPMKAEGEHDRLLAAGMNAEAAEEREKFKRENAEARQQAATANRTAREGASEWDKALAKVSRSGGGVREAAFSRV